MQIRWIHSLFLFLTEKNDLCSRNTLNFYDISLGVSYKVRNFHCWEYFCHIYDFSFICSQQNKTDEHSSKSGDCVIWNAWIRCLIKVAHMLEIARYIKIKKRNGAQRFFCQSCALCQHLRNTWNPCDPYSFLKKNNKSLGMGYCHWTLL